MQRILDAATVGESAVKALIDSGVQIDALGGECAQSALMGAAVDGLETEALCLLKNGADVGLRNSEGCTALHLASWNGHHAIVKLLLEHGADANGGDDSNVKSPLLGASVECDAKTMELLLQSGADPNVKDRSGYFPLFFAARRGDEVVVGLLLQNRANPNLRGRDGGTALHIAAKKGRHSTVEMLLQAGADVTIEDKHGFTALHMGTLSHFTAKLEVASLLAYGADVNAQTKTGDTALHMCSRKGKADALGVLLGNNADVTIKNQDGDTPLEVATKVNMSHCEKLLACNLVIAATRENPMKVRWKRNNEVFYHTRYLWVSSVMVRAEEDMSLAAANDLANGSYSSFHMVDGAYQQYGEGVVNRRDPGEGGSTGSEAVEAAAAKTPPCGGRPVQPRIEHVKSGTLCWSKTLPSSGGVGNTSSGTGASSNARISDSEGSASTSDSKGYKELILRKHISSMSQSRDGRSVYLTHVSADRLPENCRPTSRFGLCNATGFVLDLGSTHMNTALLEHLEDTMFPNPTTLSANAAPVARSKVTVVPPAGIPRSMTGSSAGSNQGSYNAEGDSSSRNSSSVLSSYGGSSHGSVNLVASPGVNKSLSGEINSRPSSSNSSSGAQHPKQLEKPTSLLTIPMAMIGAAVNSTVKTQSSVGDLHTDAESALYSGSSGSFSASFGKNPPQPSNPPPDALAAAAATVLTQSD